MIWQPIETAPKDGTPLLVFYGDDCKKYVKNNQYKYMVKANNTGGEWVHLDSGRFVRFVYDFDFEPTHWMPLPEEPK